MDLALLMKIVSWMKRKQRGNFLLTFVEVIISGLCVEEILVVASANKFKDY